MYKRQTGKVGGRQTGQKMTHYIEDGGRFQKAYRDLAASGHYILWAAVPYDPGSSEVKKKGGGGKTAKGLVALEKRSSKSKYTCCECGLNAWAKPNVKLICGVCDVTMEVG